MLHMMGILTGALSSIMPESWGAGIKVHKQENERLQDKPIPKISDSWVWVDKPQPEAKIFNLTFLNKNPAFLTT